MGYEILIPGVVHQGSHGMGARVDCWVDLGLCMSQEYTLCKMYIQYCMQIIKSITYTVLYSILNHNFVQFSCCSHLVVKYILYKYVAEVNLYFQELVSDGRSGE